MSGFLQLFFQAWYVKCIVHCKKIYIKQGGQKPGIVRNFSEHGIFREFCATSGKTNFVLCVQPVSSNPYAAKPMWWTITVDLSNVGRQVLLVI